MKAIKQKVNGYILAGSEGVMVLDDTAAPIYLSYAFVTLGPEDHILPAFLLDDWGSEKKGLSLYSWVEKNGLYFPRAEIFGFTPTGTKTQIFLRELDLVLKYRCYAYPTAETLQEDGRLIEKIFLPDNSLTEPIPAKRPANAPRLLSKSAVQWFSSPT